MEVGVGFIKKVNIRMYPYKILQKINLLILQIEFELSV